MSIREETANAAFISVTANAGATLPKRDPVDTRIAAEVRNGIATYEGVTYKQQHTIADPARKTGIIDSQDDVGGWPELRSLPAPTDTDQDGMPDEWESVNGLDPRNPSDRNKTTADGYTMLEKYLNSIG